MMDFSGCVLKKIIAHEVGNKLRDEGVNYSTKNLTWDDPETEELFLRYALSSFKNNDFSQFTHSTELELNEVFTYISRIFNNPREFEKQSKNIALHLYNQSIHPQISKGELYVVYFEDCLLDGRECSAIGIYKSETKVPFLKPQKHEANYSIRNEKGVNIDKLDKGCIVFNVDEKMGFKLSIIDGGNKSEETQYWRDHFLQIGSCNDNYHQTKNFLTLTKNFVTKQLGEEYEINNTEKAGYLKRSVEYFKTNEHFDEKKFTKEVFGEGDIIKSFNKYKENFVENSDLDIASDFTIVPDVVKKQARAFKSILKLDKNFDIYIHGNTELIQHGVEKDGRKYYKIYYSQES